MIGRAAVTSASKGISASYSCMPNCGAHGPDFRIDGNTTVFSGAYETMHTKERWYGATGGYNDYNTNLSGSTVDNSSVADLDYVSNGWLNVNGFAPGDTYWWWDYWYGYEYDDGFDCRYAQEEQTGSQPVEVMPYAFNGISVTQNDLGCPSGYVGYGAKVVYQVVGVGGVAINKAGMTPEEIVSTPGGGFNDYRPFATPTQTDASGRFNDIPIGTCFQNATSNLCIDVRQEFRIRVPTSGGEQIFFLGTQANRRDCRDGIRVTISTGVDSQTFTLGTVN